MNWMMLNTEHVRFPGLGIEDLPIDSVAFTIGNVQIYWYGILIALAMSACVVLAMVHAKKDQFPADVIIDIALVCFPAAMVGARLYYVFSEWAYYRGDLLRIINIRDGGLAVIGGVLAAFLAGFLYTRIKKLPIHTVFDFCIVYIPLGQAIGRWGNFFNQEAFGTNTNLPWGMISGQTSRFLEAYCPELDPNLPVHPTFFYESLATLVIFFALLAIRKRSRHAFETTSAYLVLYGIIRFFIEALRTDSLYIADTGIRLSQLTSALMVVIGIALFFVSRRLDWQKETQTVEALYAQLHGSNAKVRMDIDELSPPEESEIIEIDEEQVADEEQASEETVNDSADEADEIDEADDTDKESYNTKGDEIDQNE